MHHSNKKSLGLVGLGLLVALTPLACGDDGDDNDNTGATAGTGGKNMPAHVPIGGVFVKPPSNECEIFMGSQTVTFDGDPASLIAVRDSRAVK